MSNQGKNSQPETTPRGNVRSPQSLAGQVRDALRADGYVDASNIQVDVSEGGRLTLTGTVPSNEQQRRSGDRGASIQGITSVENNLEVSAHSGTSAKDAGREFGKNSETAQRPARTLGIEPEK